MTYYQFEVEKGDGWLRVGHRYQDKACAASWRSFVKRAWRGLPVRPVRATAPSPSPAGRITAHDTEARHV